ncbi:MAG: hypothetical protein BIFFINMI_01758 [Phycisphaerae bacterium]|nr:hypothetical protein [Phycisphaerae bacterium]
MPKRNLAWILIIVLAALVAWFGLPDTAMLRDNELEHFRPLLKVYKTIDTEYVERMEPIARRRMIEGAIRGMLSTLDPNTQYFTPEEAKDLQAQLSGQFTGVGVELNEIDKVVTVITPIEGSPAYRAGVRPGDEIRKVDKENAAGKSLAEVSALIKGPSGQPVELTIYRPETDQTLVFKLIRARVVQSPVKGFRPLPGGGWDYLVRQTDDGPPVGYIRVKDFIQNDEESTMSGFEAALGRCRDAHVAGVVIDLRGNPGGLLDQAVKMVDRFVAHGVIVSEQGAHQPINRHEASAAGTLEDYPPLVVLIDGGSASASEVVAGSLACHKRAVLVGTRSYGKGTMQVTKSMEGVDGGQAILKMTVAYLYLPDGRSINRIKPPADFDHPRQAKPFQSRRRGIVPTVTVELSIEQSEQIMRLRHDLDLIYPPPGAASQADAQPGSTPPSQPSPTTQPAVTSDELADRLLHADLQLVEAMKILTDPATYKKLLDQTPAPDTAPDEPEDGQ